MADWEINRYKCQIKGVNKRWETIFIRFNEDEAEKWLRAEIKRGQFPSRVVREEYMIIND